MNLNNTHELAQLLLELRETPLDVDIDMEMESDFLGKRLKSYYCVRAEIFDYNCPIDLEITFRGATSAKPTFTVIKDE